MKIQIINKSTHQVPKYQTEYAAAMDVHAFLPDGPAVLEPLQRAAISTGLFMAIPEGYELQVRSRSGLSLKHGIVCINSPGTIDADYRGELKILVANISNEHYEIHDGDRIAQLVVAKCERVEWQEAEELGETERGEGGFGHTGR
ncbi:MAG TPA: dUTP diphosphatase [Candidatus Saccharimonadales bacterium]